MMNSKIRILYIVSNIKKDSGVSSVIMNYIKNIDLTKFQIDFLSMQKNDDSYENELLEKGSNIYYLKNKFSLINMKKLKKEISIFLKNNKYEIVELHAPTFSFLFLKLAKKYNIPVRIIHSHSTIHSTNKFKNLLSIILNNNYKKYANKFFACSSKAGQYWFDKNICNSSDYEIIINGIDTDKFQSNDILRKKYRNKYNLNDYFVIGFVGRLSKDKNIDFLIDVMKKLIKYNFQYKLVLIGDGLEMDKIKKKSLSIKENILFLGRKSNVNEILNCFDILLLPSKREGLPMVALEAQLTNIPCILSDTITTEVDIGNVEFLKLDKNLWCESIIRNRKINKTNRNKFDIKYCTKKLEDIYVKYINN